MEHSLFNHISKNWNAKSKDDLEILRNYIIHTTTTTGLVVDCDIDYNIYLTEAQKKQQLRDSNIKISSLETAEERFFKKAHLEFFHDDPTMRQWNYKIVID